VTLHPQVRAVIEAAVTQDGEAGPPSLEAARANYLRTALELGGPAEPVARVEDVVIPRDDGGRLAARAYWPAMPAERLGTILWCHGGGWTVGDLDGFDRVARQLANASGAVCLSLYYRLAPENPFPAAMHDARAAVQWAVGHGARQLGADPERVLIGGDSAGGNLAAVAARHERSSLSAQLLVYPALDAAMAGDSYREYAADANLSAATMAECWGDYLDAFDAADPDASPLRARDLAGTPPAYVAVAEHDVLRDDGLRYARALEAAGVPVRFERYDDMVHGFLRWGGVVDRAQELVQALGTFAREAIAR
jgi:acetyl esterase/lipase